MHEERREKKSTVSVMSWIGTILLSAIPLVNLIMWFVWAFTSRTRSRKNYAIASLILVLVSIILAVVLAIFFGQVISQWALTYFSSFELPTAP